MRYCLNSSARSLNDGSIYGNGIVDVGFAIKNYCIFEKAYSNSNIEFPDNEITGDFKEEDFFVEGSWASSTPSIGHDLIVDDSSPSNSTSISNYSAKMAIAKKCGNAMDPIFKLADEGSSSTMYDGLTYDVVSPYLAGLAFYFRLYNSGSKC